MSDELKAIPSEVLARILGGGIADGYVAWDIAADGDAIHLFPVHKESDATMTMHTDAYLEDPSIYDAYGEDSSTDDHHNEMQGEMTARQLAIMASNESIVYEYGEWSKSDAHYLEMNPFADQGMICANCCAYEGPRGCEWVDGDIDPMALCKLWVIPTRLIQGTSTIKSVESTDAIHDVVKSVEAERFTLAPWYIPGRVDAHGEWTDSAELQKALWSYVRNADRDIRLQHKTEIKAGEWVEAVTWPFPIEVPMQKSTGAVSNVAFPADTVFLGVQWEPWAWELVRDGKINGYSIGGKSKRLLVDFDGDV